MKITLINPSMGCPALEPAVRELVDRLNGVQSAYKQRQFEKQFPERPHREVARIDRRSRTKTYWPSYGLLSIAGLLEREGFEVQYLEQVFCEDEGMWESALEMAADSDIVGITSLTPSAHNAIIIGKTLKSINSNIFIVYGGVDASYRSQVYLDGAGDIVVLGEGEQTFLKIVVTNGDERYRIPGTTSRSNSSIVKNPLTPPLNLNSLPPPAYHLLPEKLRRSSGYYILTSRGCPYDCSFCAETRFWEHRVRFKSTKTVLEEIQNLQRNFGVASGIIHFADSSFALRPEAKVREIVEELRCFPDLVFNCNLRGQMTDLPICKLLTEGNFFGCTIGMESSVDEILERMNKRIQSAEHIAFLTAVREFLPIVETHWIFGFPGETVRTANKTIDEIDSLLRKELITEAWPKIYNPYPGTRPHDNPTLFNMQIIDRDYTKYLRSGLPPVKLNTIPPETVYECWIECMKRIIAAVLDVDPEVPSLE